MTYETAKKLLERHGQGHLLEYYGELNEEQRGILLSAIGRIDFSSLKDVGVTSDKGLGKLSPADAVTLREVNARRAEYERAGIEALSQNKVAAVLLAGGQGSRLGWDGPKGTFNIGVNRELSIFACQMEIIKRNAERAGKPFNLFIMTSKINDCATREFFEKNCYFGYDKSKIHFYVQNVAPACSFDGKILLQEKYLPVLSPNGNGGWYNSLVAAGYGELLKSEGVEWLNVYGVDNVLQQICDPVFIGAACLSGTACASKVVKKASPEEKVGVLCKEDGLPAIVEYYEMPEEYKNVRDADGELTYRYGVTLNYLFNLRVLDNVCGNKLPYHYAVKKVPHIRDGVKVTPTEPNAYKPETLAVDIVKLMGSCLAVEVERDREFAPVKNATGVDSVETARQLLVKNGVKI